LPQHRDVSKIFKQHGLKQLYITERDIVWNEEEENPPESESPSKKKKKGASKKEEEQKLYPHHKYSFPACGFTQRT
jgi:hypothetical protein